MISSPAFSRIGFGVTGPHASWLVSKRTTIRLIQSAFEHGITLFDTGPAYGRGEGEKRLGEAIKALPREQVFISTKAGIHPGRRRDFSAGAVEMSIKESLARLKTSYIDLLLLHGPAPEELTERLINRLRAFKDRGMIRHIGICGRGAEIDKAIELTSSSNCFDALMAPLNPALDETAIKRLERAKDANLSVIAIEVMAGVQRSTRMPRSISDLWYLARSSKQKLSGTTTTPHALTAQDALKWTLNRPFCNAALCLTTKTNHLSSNAAAAGLEANA